IKEYEILKHTDIALTLFRSVPLLGRPDLNRRPGIASGNEFKYIPTPKSELRQTMSFSFALCLRKEYNAMEVQKTWLRYANAVLFYQLQEM
ncbi:glycosyl hydrolase family 38, partial [Erysipelatoclostridium ramosum]|nr:glycosyl hydrolase family 38 [Thomasclavelia ramosa]